jgi:hypothetical protein
MAKATQIDMTSKLWINQLVETEVMQPGMENGELHFGS